MAMIGIRNILNCNAVMFTKGVVIDLKYQIRTLKKKVCQVKGQR